MNEQKLRVAVVGVSGIGKNHARWFAGHGCEIVAICGTDATRLKHARDLMQSSFGFAGSGYLSVAAMLREEKPDIVCVASPPDFHFQHAHLALESGAHVLCEKPLVGMAATASEYSVLEAFEIVQQARELGSYAQSQNRLLGAQLQYAFALAPLRKLWNLAPGEPLRTFEAVMETKNARPGRAGREVWLDLSPHPLSLLQKMDAELLWENLDVRVSPLQTTARLLARLPHQEETCEVTIAVRVDAQKEVPQRTFSANGKVVNYAAFRDESGQFRTRLTCGENSIEMPDLVNCLVENFVATCRGEAQLFVIGEDGAQNVEWQWKLLDAAQRDA